MAEYCHKVLTKASDCFDLTEPKQYDFLSWGFQEKHQNWEDLDEVNFVIISLDITHCRKAA